MSDDKARLTGRGDPAPEPSGAPTHDRLPDGQHADHWILSAEERAKGFVRPVRTEYRHVGRPGPQHPLRDLTDDERERYADTGYVKFEEYPADSGSVIGRFWTNKELAGGSCGKITWMPVKIAETYAAQPSFYGSTFCVHCQRYLPVGEHGEFVWSDGSRVGT